MNIKFESADKINGLMTVTIEQADYQEAVDKKLKEAVWYGREGRRGEPHLG